MGLERGDAQVRSHEGSMSVLSTTTIAGIRVTEQPRCPICQNSAGQVLYDDLSDGLYQAPGKWSLLRCANASCGALWLNPRPIEQDMALLYGNYFTHQNVTPAWQSPSPLYRLWVRLGAGYRALINRTQAGQLRARAAQNFLDDLAPGRLLDVGCGEAGWLVGMRQRGWQVEGQDVDANAAQRAMRDHQIQVHVGALDELGFAAGAYDAITLSHVIEHVVEPAALLRTCARLLRPGGRLVARTPNAVGFGHAHFGRHWVALDPPRHLCVFTPAALETIALAAGLPSARTKIWTNSVHAQFIGIASRDIARQGRHDWQAAYSPSQLLYGQWFELCAWQALRKDALAGEELVLEATP